MPADNPHSDELLICARCGRAFHGAVADLEPDLYPELAYCWRCDRWVQFLRPATYTKDTP
jgi:hypothetical protein